MVKMRTRRKVMMTLTKLTMMPMRTLMNILMVSYTLVFSEALLINAFFVVAADDGTESDYGGIGGFAAELFGDDEDDSAEASAPVIPAASRKDPEIAEDADMTADSPSATIKPKEKKNKKKKNVEEEGIMYEILSGILSYFS